MKKLFFGLIILCVSLHSMSNLALRKIMAKKIMLDYHHKKLEPKDLTRYVRLSAQTRIDFRQQQKQAWQKKCGNEALFTEKSEQALQERAKIPLYIFLEFDTHIDHLLKEIIFFPHEEILSIYKNKIAELKAQLGQITGKKYDDWSKKNEKDFLKLIKIARGFVVNDTMFLQYKFFEKQNVISRLLYFCIRSSRQPFSFLHTIEHELLHLEQFASMWALLHYIEDYLSNFFALKKILQSASGQALAYQNSYFDCLLGLRPYDEKIFLTMDVVKTAEAEADCSALLFHPFPYGNYQALKSKKYQYRHPNYLPFYTLIELNQQLHSHLEQGKEEYEEMVKEFENR